MKIHADNTRKNKNPSAANNISQNHSPGRPIFQFTDNRSEAVSQRTLQEMANKSPRTMSLKSTKQMLNSPLSQAKKFTTPQAMNMASPRSYSNNSSSCKPGSETVQRLKYDTSSATNNPKKSTITQEEIAPGNMIVSITSKSFSAMPGLNHHKVQVEEWGTNAQDPSEACQHVVADLRATGGAKPGGGVTDSLAMVNTNNTPPTNGLRDGESVVVSKSVAINAGGIATLQAYHGTVGKNGYKMVMPDGSKGEQNCQTWARAQYDRL